MLIATWILAVATAVLAISGPVAFFAWRNERAQDRVRRQREREEEARERLLASARTEFVPKSWVSGAGALSVVVGILGVLAWTDGKKPK